MSLLYLIASLSPISPPSDLPQTPATTDTFQNILLILFGVIAALAVLFIVVSGLRYVVSDGSPEKAARARDGIIYALVGLAIAATAEGLVAFVTNKL